MTKPTQDEIRASELNNQGYDLAEAGRWEEALPYYNDALQHNPRNVHALTNKANALLALGRLSEALLFNDKALDIDPRHGIAWANKAVTLSALGRRPEALACYDSAIQVDPFNAVTWFNKGVALFHLGNLDGASYCFDHILKNIDPYMRRAWCVKADVLKAQGKLDEASQCIKTLETLPANPYRFSFSSQYGSLDIIGEKMDAKQFLRGIEAELRKRVGLGQIRAAFLPMLECEPFQLYYTPEKGYLIRLSLLGGRPMDTLSLIADEVLAHAKQNGIISTPPPILGTTTHVEPTFTFKTHAVRYDATAHDGGYLIAFYRQSETGAGTMMQHLPGVSVVHYKFQCIGEYHRLLKDAEKHCSAFLDLSYLGEDQVSDNTIRTFVTDNELYGSKT